MDLDDLKTRWAHHDRKLDEALRLNVRLLRETTLGKAETALRRLSRWLWLGVLADSVLLLALGSFIWAHLDEPRFLLPALALQLLAIAGLGGGVHQLVAIAGLDYDRPVLEIQKRLESLRAIRLRVEQLTLLLAPLVWIPMLIVGLKGVLGVDAYAVFPAAWLVANVVFGLAFIPAAIGVSRRYAERDERSPLARRLLRDLAGSDLNAAAGFLTELARYEAEEPAA